MRLQCAEKVESKCGTNQYTFGASCYFEDRTYTDNHYERVTGADYLDEATLVQDTSSGTTKTRAQQVRDSFSTVNAVTCSCEHTRHHFVPGATALSMGFAHGYEV